MNQPLLFSRKPATRYRAFSLIEVVVSLGIVSFCLINLLALSVLGLEAMSNASQQSGASNCLQQISTTLQNAVPNSSGAYQATYGLTNFSWSLNGQTNTTTLSNLSVDGLPSTNVPDQRLIAHVEIDSPTNANLPGSALVSVAWPNRAKWNTTTKSWSNAQGSVSCYVIFLPGQ